MRVTRASMMIATLVVAGCYQGGPHVRGEDFEPVLPGRVPSDDEPEPGDDAADDGEPGHHGEGDVEEPAGRRMRRMTAEQFHRSLVTVTGQPWPMFEKYAEAMGRADFAENTEEGRELSVTFDKFVHDAALPSCAAAIAADGDGSDTGTDGIGMRWVTVAERETVKIRRNVDYLMLRFLGQEMKGDDSRVEPWMELLTAEPDEGELDDDLMRERWTAVCIGLVTHPDFLTY